MARTIPAALPVPRVETIIPGVSILNSDVQDRVEGQHIEFAQWGRGHTGGAWLPTAAPVTQLQHILDQSGAYQIFLTYVVRARSGMTGVKAFFKTSGAAGGNVRVTCTNIPANVVTACAAGAVYSTAVLAINRPELLSTFTVEIETAAGATPFYLESFSLIDQDLAAV